MSRNPFELRADVLKQAQELLEKQYDASVKFFMDFYWDSLEANKKTLENFKELAPKFPTPEEVITQAEKFAYFVDGSR